MSQIALKEGRVAGAKTAFTTRRIDLTDIRTVLPVSGAEPGDLVLARVRTLGFHTGLQLRSGRRADLYPGDEIIACAGHRYAPDQFEAHADIGTDACHLVAAGGVIGVVRDRHADVAEPTKLEPIGLLGDGGGRRLNVRDYGLAPLNLARRSPTVAVLGTSMNAGKTTVAACLARGLASSEIKVAACKITGTGAFKDIWAMVDAGAVRVLDFTDAGHVSTYRLDLPDLERIIRTVTGHLLHSGAERIVMEVADGLAQRETAMLVRSEFFRTSIDGVIFAASDAMSAVGGVETLRRNGLTVLGISGLITNSPLACREAAEGTGVPVFTRSDLVDPACAASLFFPGAAALSA